jgi:hypothetical protein
MFRTSGDGATGTSAGLRYFPEIDDADGESFEIRYVDAAEAATWASERGYLFPFEDIAVRSIAYPE